MFGKTLKTFIWPWSLGALSGAGSAGWILCCITGGEGVIIHIGYFLKSARITKHIDGLTGQGPEHIQEEKMSQRGACPWDSLQRCFVKIKGDAHMTCTLFISWYATYAETVQSFKLTKQEGKEEEKQKKLWISHKEGTEIQTTAVGMGGRQRGEERRGERRGRSESERGKRGRAGQCWESVGEREREQERNRAETGRGRQTKLGQVTWLGSTAGRIKYPTACGHLHNKCSFHFINYFFSVGNEARHGERDAALHSGREWGFSASMKTEH